MNVDIPWAGITAVLLALVMILEIFRIHSRLERLDEMLARLLRHLNVDVGMSMEPSETVKLLAADPKSYVAAIKAYREQTGLGLKPAKAVIDHLVSDQRAAA